MGIELNAVAPSTGRSRTMRTHSELRISDLIVHWTWGAQLIDRPRYENFADALATARDNSDAIQRLGTLGCGNVVVAEILNVDGAFVIRSVVVGTEESWRTSPQQYIVRRFEFGSLACPVCDRVGERQGEYRVGNAIMQTVGALDPSGCRGCHDVLTHNGIAPADFSTNPPSPIGRP